MLFYARFAWCNSTNYQCVFPFEKSSIDIVFTSEKINIVRLQVCQVRKDTQTERETNSELCYR